MNKQNKNSPTRTAKLKLDKDTLEVIKNQRPINLRGDSFLFFEIVAEARS